MFVLLQFVLGCAPHDVLKNLTGAGSHPGPPASLEQLGAQIGCRPRVQSQNTDFRQGTCQTPATRYVVATFTTDKGQQDWLREAQPYGGTYLAGTRWIVSTDQPEALEDLSERLGGAIQEGASHH